MYPYPERCSKSPFPRPQRQECDSFCQRSKRKRNLDARHRAASHHFERWPLLSPHRANCVLNNDEAQLVSDPTHSASAAEDLCPGATLILEDLGSGGGRTDRSPAEFIWSFAAATELVLVGSSREAVDDWSEGSRIRVVRLSECIVQLCAARSPAGQPKAGGGGITPQLRSRCGSIGRAAAYEAALRNKLWRQLRRKESLTMKSPSYRLARVPFPLK